MAQDHRVTRYARSVADGDVPAGRLQRLACDRHLNDLQHARERGLRFDVELADRAIRFFGFLRHSKGEWAGQSFDLAEWQAFIVGSLFGWLREDGLRRFRTAYVEVPRKNGKSTLLSGIGLYLLIADDEPGAEIYTAATKRDQARITHGEAARMVKASPFLRNRIGAFRDNLHVEATHSKFEPLGADSDTMDGLNIHGAIIDELHAHKTSGVVDVLDTATGARRQPLIVEITTAGWDRQSICWQHHEYTRQIVEGLIEDDSWFGFIAAADADDDWTDERTWQKANPNYSVSVKTDDLRRKALKAQQMPAAQNSFKRLHLNIWTEQADRWMTIEAWDKCAGALDPEMLIGRECYAGLDLASTTDIAALVLVFPSDDDPTIYDVLCYFWVPAETVLQRTRSGSVPYATWVDQGLIFATEGNVIDYRAIMATLDELAQLYDIREVAYDRWGATELIQTLQDEGLEVVPFGQGFVSMSPPTKSLMTMVLSERIRHSNNPVLRWMAGNMVVREDPAGNLKPDKSKSTEKIDGMVALIMGLDRAERHENGSSVYEERDLLVI